MKKIILGIFISVFIFSANSFAEDQAEINALKDEIRLLKERIVQLEKVQLPLMTPPLNRFSSPGTQWDPTEEMRRMQEEMSQAFQHSFDRWGKAISGGFNNMITYDTQYKFEEKDNGYIVEIDTTGFDKDKLDIKFDDDSITISGTAHLVETKNESQNVFKTQSMRSFLKTIPLPKDADANEIKMEKQKNKVVINIPKKKI